VSPRLRCASRSRLQPRLLEHQSDYAPADGDACLVRATRGNTYLAVRLDVSLDPNSIAQPASGLNHGRAERPFSTELDFLEQVDASETESLTRARMAGFSVLEEIRANESAGAQ